MERSGVQHWRILRARAAVAVGALCLLAFGPAVRPAFAAGAQVGARTSCSHTWGRQRMRPAALTSASGTPLWSRTKAAAVAQESRLDVRRERQEIKKHLAKYRANNGEAWRALLLTSVLWGLGFAALHWTGGSLASILFMALVVARCFMTFHDAAHLSFFEDVQSNKILASVMQFFVQYSHSNWDEVHNSHHAHFGDSTVKDTSLTIFFSEEELSKMSMPLRCLHRVIRDPLLFFPLAGFFVFFVNKPLKHGIQRITIPILIWLTLGPQTTLAYLLSTWVSGMIGVTAFHLQHSCNSPYRVEGPADRSSFDAAMVGSTRIPVCFPFSIFSFGIECHHIHHLDTRVPGYRLPRCDAEGARQGLWSKANTVDAWRAFKSMFHTQFAGSSKYTADGTPPRFVSFWPYSVLGLQDA
mmetsp:Transcript_55543/g.119889  ORF Transcript_55543/g.119889 Transcript_55543/m.119889 type:complete len:412 (-) Transcript_55543:232-1467(-)